MPAGSGAIGSGLMGPEVGTYASFASLPSSAALGDHAWLTFAAAPAGKILMFKAASGWEPEIDQIVGYVSADVSLVSVDTNYAQVWSVNMSNLIPDGSVYEVAALGYVTTSTAASLIRTDLNGSANGYGVARTGTTGHMLRRLGTIHRTGASLRSTTGGDTAWAGTTGTVETPNFASFSMGFGWTPGEAGASLILRKGSYIKRIG